MRLTRTRARAAFVAVGTGAFLLQVSAVVASGHPQNDERVSATVVASVPFAETIDTTQATRADDDPATGGRDCFGTETRTVWYRFIAPGSATYALDTAGSDYDTTIAVYRSGPGGLSLVDCSGYFDGTFQGRLLLAAESGTRYEVMVAASSPDTTGGSLHLSVVPSPVAPLDVELVIDPDAGLLGNGEVELRGEVTCSRAAEVGLDGALEQGTTYSYLFPEPFACGPEAVPFRAPTRERDGTAFRAGRATALIVAYGYDEFDRDVPEVTTEVQIGPSRIVFARSTADQDRPRATELFIMDGDGTEVTQLTRNATEDNFPALSPDGRHVAFAREHDGQFDLFIISSDGSRIRRLTRTSHDEVLPSWSPDGTRLVFTATFTNATGWQSDIHKMRLLDGRVRALTDTPRIKEFAPEWAPDGTLIAFTKQNQRRHRYGIATIDPRGEGLEWLVINPLSRHGYTDVNPTWSPHSRWVAFSRDHGADPYVDIYKVGRDGGEVVAVTELFELAENPAWGPDGTIAFQHNEGIAVIARDTGEITHITPTITGIPYQWPDW